MFTFVPTLLFAGSTACGGGAEDSGVLSIGDATFSLSDPAFVCGEFGFAAFAATDAVFAVFVALLVSAFFVVRLGLKGVGSIGGLAALL